MVKPQQLPSFSRTPAVGTRWDADEDVRADCGKEQGPSDVTSGGIPPQRRPVLTSPSDAIIYLLLNGLSSEI